MTNKEKFIQVLKEFGVTKCRVSPDFDFEAKEPDGDIRINVKNSRLETAIYKIFTVDNGLVGENQTLGVWYNDFSSIEPNFEF